MKHLIISLSLAYSTKPLVEVSPELLQTGLSTSMLW
jgi:hypothetical protein